MLDTVQESWQRKSRDQWVRGSLTLPAPVGFFAKVQLMISPLHFVHTPAFIVGETWSRLQLGPGRRRTAVQRVLLSVPGRGMDSLKAIHPGSPNPSTTTLIAYIRGQRSHEFFSRGHRDPSPPQTAPRKRSSSNSWPAPIPPAASRPVDVSGTGGDRWRRARSSQDEELESCGKKASLGFLGATCMPFHHLYKYL